MNQPLDLVAPHSQEAEESVLGSVLINPEAFTIAGTLLKESDFFVVRNGWVWAAITAIFERGYEIDNVTVVDELKRRSQLESVGGSGYITSLINNTPTYFHIETYAEIVRRASIRRKLIGAAGEIANIALKHEGDADEVVELAEGIILGITQESSPKTVQAAPVVMSGYMDIVFHRQEHGVKALTTGFHDLDFYLDGGPKEGDLVIIAGRPGMGKTSLMLNLALNAARKKQKILFMSAEMTTEQILDKLIATQAMVDYQRLQLGKLDEGEDKDELSRVVKAAGELAHYSLFLDDSSAVTVPQVRMKAQRVKREHGLDGIFIDYLGLMHGVGRFDNRTGEIGLITSGLKQLAKDLNVPVILAAQLSRATESRTEKRATLSDLRESGNIEQDADTVLFLYRDEYYLKEESEKPNDLEVAVAKQRKGRSGGTAHLFFNMARSAIYDELNPREG